MRGLVGFLKLKLFNACLYVDLQTCCAELSPAYKADQSFRKPNEGRFIWLKNHLLWLTSLLIKVCKRFQYRSFCYFTIGNLGGLSTYCGNLIDLYAITFASNGLSNPTRHVSSHSLDIVEVSAYHGWWKLLTATFMLRRRHDLASSSVHLELVRLHMSMALRAL
jgi:hypothetical protein